MDFQVKYITPTKRANDDPIAKEFGPSFETKFDELKNTISQKMEQEMLDSENVRNYVSQKYEDVCKKIQFLTELDATVSGFRTDVKAIEKQVLELETRLNDVEKRLICKECPSLSSSMF